MNRKPRALGLVAGLLLALLALPSLATDRHDFSKPSEGSAGVFVTGGDTPLLTSVACTSNSTAVQLVAARSDRSRRRVCFQNQGNTTVKIGTSTISASDLFNLGESTNSATSPQFCSNSASAFYCTAGLTTSDTVVVIEETQSIP